MGESKSMNTVKKGRRRSDRLWLTVPLRVEVVDSKGEAVEYPGRAINLNRHGGRIQIPQKLNPHQPIRVRSPIGRYETEFRVVETIGSHGESSCDCGVECLNHEENFWGIEFPAMEEDKASEAKVLLECRMCHTVALVPLALLEVVTLQTISMVGLDCPKCSAVTFWRYAEMRAPMNRAPERPQDGNQGRINWIAHLSEAVERGHRRALVQMPLGLSDCWGNSHLVRTENISECGFCFSTEKKYLRGEIVTAAFPIPAMTRSARMPARIVREQVLEGGPSKIYGATFQAGNGGCHGA